VLAGLVLGCSSSPTGPSGSPAPTPLPVGAVVPEVALGDVNTASASFGRNVSPRDYLGQATAWYFASAT
jgi:hypothetical protein